ncbi:recombinase family protein [Apilactobacillus kunkeei]|uniref:recombinase family protein n=1 Tax=Apilactobacillus kunkeei TaxID=148814 RepID=UPI0009B92984
MKKSIYTGTSTDRVGFQKLLDTLVVTKLDRLARNIREALNVLNELQARNIKTNFLYLYL